MDAMMTKEETKMTEKELKAIIEEEKTNLLIGARIFS